MSGQKQTPVNIVSLREPILAELDGEYRSKGELTQNLTISRSTVNRALQRLENRGLVRETAKGYTLTTVGECVYVDFLSWEERVDFILDHAELINDLPKGQAPDPRLFNEATIIRARSSNPLAPIEELESNLKDSHIRCVLPSGHSELLRTIFNESSGGEAVVSPIADSQIGEKSMNTSHLDIFKRAVRIKFGLIMTSTEVIVVIFDRDGFVRLVSRTSNDISYFLAKNLFQNTKR